MTRNRAAARDRRPNHHVERSGPGPKLDGVSTAQATNQRPRRTDVVAIVAIVAGLVGTLVSPLVANSGEQAAQTREHKHQDAQAHFDNLESVVDDASIALTRAGIEGEKVMRTWRQGNGPLRDQRKYRDFERALDSVFSQYQRLELRLTDRAHAVLAYAGGRELIEQAAVMMQQMPPTKANAARVLDYLNVKLEDNRAAFLTWSRRELDAIAKDANGE